MQGNRLQALVILLRSVSATLRITITTLADVYRGIYRREVADRRLRWWSSRLLDLVHARCVVVGDPNVALPDGRPLMVMSNHASLYDIPLLFVALPGSMRMLTKKELFRVPIWGRGLAAGEFVSIDRHDHAQALRDLDAAREKMASGISLWVAPEGTRSRDGTLGEFKKGGAMLAIQTGAVIVPVGIRGSREILPPKTFFHVRLGCAPEVHVGEPIDAGAYSLERRDELLAILRERILALAGIREGKRGQTPCPH
jgi:1-acyl-sn-glycerol-3-phosphate acyltransferase